MNSAQQAVADMRAVLDGQRAFNRTPDDHPAETAAFDQSAQLLGEITDDKERAMFVISGLAMIVVGFADDAEIEQVLGMFDTSMDED